MVTNIIPQTKIDRLSVNFQGNEGNNFSINPSISADSNYIAFESAANNLVIGDTNNQTLVIGDTNNQTDIFITNREFKTTNIVSVNSFGAGGNLNSFHPSISSDGRFVAFASNANNLVLGDNNNTTDIFLRDLLTATTTRISVDSLGNQSNAASVNPTISADGRFIAFESDATNLVTGDINNARDIFLHDTLTGMTAQISRNSLGDRANFSSFNPTISADGRFIAFDSFATNIVAGDTNNTRDIFLHDTLTGITSSISVDALGNQGDFSSIAPSISTDGRFIAFESTATNLVPGDTNGVRDIFVRDLLNGITTRVSVDIFGNQVSRSSFAPTISGDGRFVAFDSFDPLLVPGDSNGTNDIFVRDLLNGVTTKISVNDRGLEGNLTSFNPAISASGEVVAFDSFATNLVAGDANNSRDVFVWSQNLFE